MVDLEKPKSKAISILPGEAMSKPAGRGDFEIVQHNHRASRRLVHGQEKRVLSLRGIGRAIDEDQLRALQSLKRFALRRDIERLNRPEAIPATSQWNDVGKIGLTLGDGILEVLGAAQPIGRVFDAGRSGGCASKRMRRTTGPEFKCAAARGQESGYLFQEPATGSRKDPGRHLRGGLTPAMVFLNEALKPNFERSFGRSRIGFSDNPSELLSAFRHAWEVSARF